MTHVLDTGVAVKQHELTLRVKDSKLKMIRDELDSLLHDLSICSDSNDSETVAALPTVATDLIPYKYKQKEHLIGTEVTELLAVTVDGKLFPCTLCKAQLPVKETRVHISFHLLHIPGFLQDKTCGFCGLNCTTVLVKNRNGKSTPKSTCKRFNPF